MIEVNGKVYPLWGQFIERKDEWIGGILEDLDVIWENTHYSYRRY